MREDTYDLVDEISDIDDLGDIGDELEVLARQDLGNPTLSAQRIKKMQLILAKNRLMKRKRAGGVQRGETKGLVPSTRTLFARRFTANAAIATNQEYFFFHKGVEDAVTEYGYTAGGGTPTAPTNLTERYTNLRRDGKLPQNEVFVCNGISFEFPEEITDADLARFGEGLVRWEEHNGSTSIQLGTVAEMPRVYGMDLEWGSGAVGSGGSTGVGSTSGAVNNRRFQGPKYVFKKPLFIIRGAIARSDQPKLVVKFYTGWTLAADTEWTCRLHGLWFQHKSGGR